MENVHTNVRVQRVKHFRENYGPFEGLGQKHLADLATFECWL